jgi:DNA-binding LacI/PurR family transcriptional regulator
MDESSRHPAARPSPPTIRDVAEAAGVSKSLVSLVLRDPASVSPHRRQAVLEAIERLDYRAPRARTSPRTGTVGVLLNDLRNPWFVDALEGLSTALQGAGVDTLLADSRTNLRIGRDSVQSMITHGVQGIIVVGTTAEAEAIRAAADRIPIVLAGTRDPDLPGVDIVVNDDHAGAAMATRHLIELGHTAIAHLVGPDKIGRLRHAGYLDTMVSAGLASAARSEHGGMTEESGYAAARRLLTGWDRPTAIVAFNDLAAIGALSAAAELGLDVPGDLSVVGYDNTSLAALRRIALTSVDDGNFPVGAQAGALMLDRIAAPTRERWVQVLPTALEVRGTTAAPR